MNAVIPRYCTVMCMAVLAAVMLASVSALADDLAPPPWRGAPGSTFQHWQYNQDNPLPDVWNNPHGQPTETTRSSALWLNDYGGRQGVLSLVDGYVGWYIPNHFEPTLPKWVRVQFTVDIAQFNWAGNPTVGPVTQLETDPATGITWYHHWADYVIPCQPFTLFLQGTVAMDQLVVDTVCVPEPGTMLLSSIGFGVVGAALRRRRKA